MTACPATARRLALLALILAACSSSTAPAADPDDLLGLWRLVALEATGAAPLPSPDPDRFTATFEADGRLAVRSDCNRCQGSYSAGADGALRVGPLACTQAACPTAPFDLRLTALLSQSTAWSVQDDGLTLGSPTGVLRFQR